MKTIITFLIIVVLILMGMFLYDMGFSDGIDAALNPKFHTSEYRLIQLSSFDGGSLWINPDTIVSMADLEATEKFARRTRIDTDDGDFFLVKESADFIQRLIDNPPSENFYVGSDETGYYDVDMRSYNFEIEGHVDYTKYSYVTGKTIPAFSLNDFNGTSHIFHPFQIIDVVECPVGCSVVFLKEFNPITVKETKDEILHRMRESEPEVSWEDVSALWKNN